MVDILPADFAGDTGDGLGSFLSQETYQSVLKELGLPDIDDQIETRPSTRRLSASSQREAVASLLADARRVASTTATPERGTSEGRSRARSSPAGAIPRVFADESPAAGGDSSDRERLRALNGRLLRLGMAAVGGGDSPSTADLMSALSLVLDQFEQRGTVLQELLGRTSGRGAASPAALARKVTALEKQVSDRDAHIDALQTAAALAAKAPPSQPRARARSAGPARPDPARPVPTEVRQLRDQAGLLSRRLQHLQRELQDARRRAGASPGEDGGSRLERLNGRLAIAEASLRRAQHEKDTLATALSEEQALRRAEVSRAEAHATAERHRAERAVRRLADVSPGHAPSAAEWDAAQKELRRLEAGLHAATDDAARARRLAKAATNRFLAWSPPSRQEATPNSRPRAGDVDVQVQPRRAGSDGKSGGTSAVLQRLRMLVGVESDRHVVPTVAKLCKVRCARARAWRGEGATGLSAPA